MRFFLKYANTVMSCSRCKIHCYVRTIAMSQKFLTVEMIQTFKSSSSSSIIYSRDNILNKKTHTKISLTKLTWQITKTILLHESGHIKLALSQFQRRHSNYSPTSSPLCSWYLFCSNILFFWYHYINENYITITFKSYMLNELAATVWLLNGWLRTEG